MLHASGYSRNGVCWCWSKGKREEERQARVGRRTEGRRSRDPRMQGAEAAQRGKRGLEKGGLEA